MAAEKSRRAGAIVAALPHLDPVAQAKLLTELAGYYPHAQFTWDEHGLRIRFGIGSIRLPASVWHAAYYIDQHAGLGKYSVLKSTLPEDNPPPPPPKTAWERLGDDFD